MKYYVLASFNQFRRCDLIGRDQQQRAPISSTFLERQQTATPSRGAAPERWGCRLLSHQKCRGNRTLRQHSLLQASALFALRNWTLSINKHNIHHTHYQNFEFFYSKQQNLPTLEADPIVEEEFPFSGKLGGRPRANPSFHFMRTNEAIKWQQMAWVASVWPFGSLTWKESATLKLK